MAPRSKHYKEYRLSVLNDRREFLHIILTDSDPPALSFKDRDYLLEFEATFVKSLNTK